MHNPYDTETILRAALDNMHVDWSTWKLDGTSDKTVTSTDPWVTPDHLGNLYDTLTAALTRIETLQADVHFWQTRLIEYVDQNHQRGDSDGYQYLWNVEKGRKQGEYDFEEQEYFEQKPRH